jgi:hypothetical protein
VSKINVQRFVTPMFYTYILQSLKDKSLYISYTADLSIICRLSPRLIRLALPARPKLLSEGGNRSGKANCQRARQKCRLELYEGQKLAFLERIK